MAAIAVHAHKQKNDARKKPNSFQPALGKAHLERLARTKDAKLLEDKMKQLFRKYDTNKDRRLDHAELRGLLTEVADDGTEATMEDTTFVLRMADKKTTDGEVEIDELGGALAAWKLLRNDKNFISAKFETYDTNGDGLLAREEIGRLLLELNSGEEVPEEEIDWILSRADRDSDKARRPALTDFAYVVARPDPS